MLSFVFLFHCSLAVSISLSRFRYHPSRIILHHYSFSFIIVLFLFHLLDAINITIGDAIKALWTDPGMKQCWDRRAEFQIIESVQYYFNKIDVIKMPDYLPDKDDILFSRVRTSGIVTERYIIDGNHSCLHSFLPLYYFPFTTLRLIASLLIVCIFYTLNTTPSLHHYPQYEPTRHKLSSPFTSLLHPTSTTNNNH